MKLRSTSTSRWGSAMIGGVMVGGGVLSTRCSACRAIAGPSTLSSNAAVRLLRFL
jgi:hypothetical protein